MLIIFPNFDIWHQINEIAQSKTYEIPSKSKDFVLVLTDAFDLNYDIDIS